VRRSQDRPTDSLSLGAAYAGRRDWQTRLAAAEAAGDEAAAREAARFVAEYDDFIAELETHAKGE
jgi:hypothetical protein